MDEVYRKARLMETVPAERRQTDLAITAMYLPRDFRWIGTLRDFGARVGVTDVHQQVLCTVQYLKSGALGANSSWQYQELPNQQRLNAKNSMTKIK